MHSVCYIIYFCIAVYNIGVQTHRKYAPVQGVPMCPKCEDKSMRASVCQRPALVSPSGQQAQSLVPPTPSSSCQLKEVAVKMLVGGCHCPTLEIQSPMLPRESMPTEEYICGPQVL